MVLNDGVKVDVFKITSKDYAPLKQEIVIDVNKCDPDKDGWVAWLGLNEKYGIRCVTSSDVFKNWKWLMKRRLKEYAVENLDFRVYEYIIANKDNVTDKLREIINNLKEIIDPDKWDGEPWVEVDVDDEVDDE